MTELEGWFHLANSRYFRKRLKNVTVKWKRKMPKGRMARTLSPQGKTRGTRQFRIEMACELRRMRSVAIMTLLHEMVHVEQWDEVTQKTCHGRKFQRRMKKLAAQGAFVGLW